MTDFVPPPHDQILLVRRQELKVAYEHEVSIVESQLKNVRLHQLRKALPTIGAHLKSASASSFDSDPDQTAPVRWWVEVKDLTYHASGEYVWEVWVGVRAVGKRPQVYSLKGLGLSLQEAANDLLKQPLVRFHGRFKLIHEAQQRALDTLRADLEASR